MDQSERSALPAAVVVLVLLVLVLLVPAVEAAGLSFGELLRDLFQRAAARG